MAEEVTQTNKLEPILDVQDEQVLSHAAKRKMKKRKRDQPEEPEQAVPTIEEKTEEVETGPKPKKPKKQNSVWIGNLSYKTSEADIRKFFEDVDGEITRVNLPTKPNGKEIKGFAYVDFDTPEAQSLAVGFTERLLLGRKVLIKVDSNWEGSKSVNAMTRPNGKAFIVTKTAKKILDAQKQPPCPVLFMGNLPFDATEETIRSFIESSPPPKPSRKSKHEEKERKEEEPLRFDAPAPKPKEQEEEEALSPESFGLKKVRIGTFEDTGKCKGWAFLDFETTAHATETLLRSSNHSINGRKLVLEYASPDAVRRGGYDSGGKPLKSLKKGRPQKSERMRLKGFSNLSSKPLKAVEPQEEDGDVDEEPEKEELAPIEPIVRDLKKMKGEVVKSRGKRTVFT